MKISKKRMQSEYMNRLSGLHKEEKEMKAIFKGIVMGIVVALIMVLPFLLAITPDKIYKLKKDHSDIQTISLKAEDKYYKNYNRMLERWKIIVKYNNKEKEIVVTKDDFYKIKVGDKVLCDVYCQGKKIVAIELNEHWKETS